MIFIFLCVFLFRLNRFCFICSSIRNSDTPPPVDIFRLSFVVPKKNLLNFYNFFNSVKQQSNDVPKKFQVLCAKKNLNEEYK
jgi:hypothetical protein